MAKKHELIFKNETIKLSKGEDGFWLYDYTRGMNLAMRCSSESEAFVEAITYYQGRLLEVENKYSSLIDNINDFITNIYSEVQ